MASVPGLSSVSTEQPTTNNVELQPETEWRFETAIDQTIHVKLINGTAEVFGTELVKGVAIPFSSCKGAIFSWTGCQLEWTLIPNTDDENNNAGVPAAATTSSSLIEYTSEETPMSVYLNLHFALDKMRHSNSPPRVLIAGPTSSGKTSLAKILTSYAVKLGRAPTVVNLDPKEGMLTIPGTLSASSFISLIDQSGHLGWGTSSTNGPNQIPAKVPIVYYYGFESPNDNIPLYKQFISRLGLSVNSRLQEDSVNANSGLIIDTSGVVDPKDGYSILQSIISEFSVNVIVVVGHERLYSDMTKKYATNNPKRTINVVKVPKSGGVADRDAAYMRAIQQQQIKEYFYGTPAQPLSPYSISIENSSLDIYRINDASNLMGLSVLPIADEYGSSTTSSSTNDGSRFFTHVESLSTIHSCILALTHANPSSFDQDNAQLENYKLLSQSSVMGFVHVIESDNDKRKRVKLLMPLPGRLPSKLLLAGSFTYHE